MIFVSARTILQNFIDLSVNSVVFAFLAATTEAEGEEEAYVFNLIILANQGDSPGKPKSPSLSHNSSLTITMYSFGGD